MTDKDKAELAKRISTFPGFTAEPGPSRVDVFHHDRPVGCILFVDCQDKTLWKTAHLHASIRRKLLDQLWPWDADEPVYFLTELQETP